jgi:DNA repair protein RecO (recombination protein O)
MQNRITDQAAFILHRRDYQESSLILDIFSEQFGRLSVLAKAAKKRRDASHFQICNRLLLGWSGRSDLKTLTQIDSQALTISADFYPSVFYMNELLLYLLPKHQPYYALFQGYQQLLLQFAEPQADMSQLPGWLRNFEMELLTELGYLPDLSLVSATGQALNAGLRYRVDASSGVCMASESEAETYSADELQAIQRRQFDTPGIARTARLLLRRLIDFNLQGRALQSRQFYQQLKK